MLKPALTFALLFAASTPAFADTPINVTIPLGIKNVGAKYTAAVIACRMSPLTEQAALANLATSWAQGVGTYGATAPLTSGTNENTVLLQIVAPASPTMNSLICELQGFMTAGSAALVPVSAITLDSGKKFAPNIVGQIPKY